MKDLSFSPPNVLVVDDVNANLVVLTELIQKAGYTVRPVTNARQAVSAIEALTPSLILLDVSMPDIDGFLFCSMLKKNANTRDIPVIFISALNTPEDKIKAFQLGAVDYIAKPFEVEEVTLRINTHLKMHKMQQELEVYNKKLYKIINDQMRKIYEEQKNTVFALAKLIVKGNNKEANHLENVAKNSRLLALSLQLSPNYQDLITNSFIDAIEISGLLHDIGEFSISENILNKTKELKMKEIEIIKAHTLYGAELLKDIYSLYDQNEFMKLAIEIALHHHENWNGTGYPLGLEGTDIPLSARIVSIVDVYDSLITDNIKRKAYSHEISMEIINEASGIQFDPDIVAVFNKIQNKLKR